MNCEHLQQLFNSGDVAALTDSERQEVTAHVRTCESCRLEWIAHQAALRFEVPAAPDGLLYRIDEAARRRRSNGNNPRPRIFLWILLLLGALAGATVIAVRYLSEGDSTEEARPELDQNPVEPQVPDIAPNARDPRAPPAADESGGQIGAIERPARVRAVSADPSLDRATLLVLPFTDTSGDAEFSAGGREFHRRFLRAIRQTDALNVLRPEIAEPFLTNGMSASAAARQLGAGSYVEIKTSREAASSARDAGQSFWATQLDSSSEQIMLGIGTMSVGGNWVLCGSNPYPVPDNADSAAAFDCDGRIESFVDGIVRALFPGSPAPASEQLISDLEARLLDATQDDVARLEALTRLAGLAGRGGARRLSATSIVGAVTLQTLSDERVVRRGVWQTIAGTKDPYVTEPLVASLRTDADPSVRAAAARALASFADDRDVRAALQAAAGDPSESVRRAAQAALKTVADRQQEALESLTDNSLPESDRLFPFNAIWYDPELLPINAGIAAALLDMARNSMDPAIRSNAWTALTADDYFRDASVLLEALRTDPDDSVRGLLVNLLVQYASDPAVIDALDAIAVKEPSRSLRATAAQALERARTSVR